MRRCLGITKDLHRCSRRGNWRLFCDLHKRQWISWLTFFIFTVGGGTASILSLFANRGVPSFRQPVEKKESRPAFTIQTKEDHKKNIGETGWENYPSLTGLLIKNLGKHREHEELKKLLDTLGIPTEINTFDYCYFYSYYDKGLSLRFGVDDNILSTVFLYSGKYGRYSQYKAPLPINVSYTDTAETFRQSIGKPYNKIDNWFLEYRLQGGLKVGFQFAPAGDIEHIQVSKVTILDK